MALPEAVRLTVSLDSAESIEGRAVAARAAGRPVRVFVELDVGMHRVGVTTWDDAIALVAPRARAAAARIRRDRVLSGTHPRRCRLAGIEAGRVARGARERARRAGARRRAAGRRERRLHADDVAHARGDRRNRVPSGDVRLQRSRHGGDRGMRLGRLRVLGAGHGREHERAESGGDRRRRQGTGPRADARRGG